MKFIAGILISVLMISAPAMAETDEAIDACLSAWGKHPFEKTNPKFRVISPKVKVMGIGGDVNDDGTTDKPELVLIKPSVSVMAKTKYSLMNPNGWYCMKGGVAVMGKTAIEVHCKAHLASSKDGVAVLGAQDDKSGGVAVMGSVRVKRVGCENGK